MALTFFRDMNDLDGSYLVFNNKRSLLIRNGMAKVGLLKRWKGHTTSSKLSNGNAKGSNLYLSYPHPEYTPNNQPYIRLINVSFHKIHQMVAVGKKKEHMNDLMTLFDWTKNEEH